MLGPATDFGFGRAADFGAVRWISTTQIPLPVAVDPNDMLMQDAFNRSDFGDGLGIATAVNPDDPVAVLRIVPNVKLIGTYNTGSPNSDNLSPSGFALQGSKEARARGRFAMDETTANLKTDLQIPDVTTQVFLDIQAPKEGTALDFRQIFARTGNLLGGKYYSSFADNGTLPQTIFQNSAPAGAIAAPNVVQLQYVRLFDSGILIGAAVENPTSTDFTLVSDTDVRLQRVPDFVARVRYQPLDAWGSVQGAILLRQFAYNDVNGADHFTNVAVSFSSNARFKVFDDNNVRLGVVGGQGAGSRIFGLTDSAVAAGPSNGSLVPLQNVGTFISYQHFWSDFLWTNLAYGYAFADTTPTMREATRRSQNGWVNLVWNNPSAKVALAVEYQAGQQEVGNGQHGFNHGIAFFMQLGKGYQSPDGGSGGGAVSAMAAPRGYAEPQALPGAGQVYPRL